MSLFKIRNFWTTHSEHDESFDQNSLIVHKLNSDFDVIITASHSGILRIFNPNCTLIDNGGYQGFSPNDLVVEKSCDSPILQVATGKLVLGNPSTQLAVLHPRSLTVYSLVFHAGKTDHGNQSYLQVVYEHKLHRSAASFVIGPFGGCQNRDFICVQSLDGILSFFEQESQVHHVTLPDFLLPAPLCYIIKTDSFVTSNSGWEIISYRYKVLLDASEEYSDPIYAKPKMLSEWTYNLGEWPVDIQVINDVNNRQTWIVVLGEKNLFCLSENGQLKFMKKLDYCPICMHIYVIDTNIYTIITSETQMLLVYENTTLKWSAQSELLPVSLNKIFLKDIKGALVLLSEDGRLDCCYLGTEPSFFIAPPLNVPEIDFVKAEEELKNLEKTLADSYNIDPTAQNNTEKDLQVTLFVDSNIEICTYQHNIKNAASNYMCRVTIKLQPQRNFQEVQVSVYVLRPLKVVPSIHFFSNLCDGKTLESHVFVDEAQDVPSLELEIKVSLITNLGVPHAISKKTMLPATLILEACSPEKENTHRITLIINQSAVGLSKLFPEYIDIENQQSSPNAIGLRGPSGNTGTILLAKSSERYRLQSNSLSLLSVVLEQLILRLRRNFANASDFKIIFNSSLPSPEVFEYISEHFAVKNEVKKLKESLSQVCAQFRLIQKRLITKYRAKNPSSLKSLEFLLDDTHADILEAAGNLESENEKLFKCQINLSCALHLIKQLIGLLNIDDELVTYLNSIFCPLVNDIEGQAWEDVMDGSLCYLLRTVMAKTEKDRLRAPQTSFEEINNMAKFEKHFSQVLERIPKQNSLKESNDGLFTEETEIQPDKSDGSSSDQKIEKPIGSQYGEFSTRLLSARKSLMRRHTTGEGTNEDLI
ncbi:protein PTHB1 [Anthonomus grandis grandis]|uniref:protein PTHB1 n=1 Tax=Anthonomus grandis grandis TaxID=2921223 RepID=UPI0021665E27|nr:protein PTHB1 [Anthonomus grandis grandis]